MRMLNEIYDTLMHKYPDPRITAYPLMGSPIPVISILLAYCYMVKKGPQWMAQKPAYNITFLIQTYNIIQVLLCAYISIRGMFHIRLFTSACVTTYTTSEDDLELLFLTWMYCIIKVTDLLDTLFFILRKKFNLLTTLHTYHHFLMVSSTIFIGRYEPGGEMLIMGWLNSIVHTFMYSYYFCCLRNKGRQNVWWKKHITHLQLAQFSIVSSAYLWKLFFVTNCDYPKSILVFAIVQNLAMIKMFGSYYYNAFIKTKNV